MSSKETLVAAAVEMDRGVKRPTGDPNRSERLATRLWNVDQPAVPDARTASRAMQLSDAR
jgi:hypothetical protein